MRDRSRSRCASSSRELAAMKESEQMVLNVKPRIEVITPCNPPPPARGTSPILPSLTARARGRPAKAGDDHQHQRRSARHRVRERVNSISYSPPVASPTPTPPRPSPVTASTECGETTQVNGYVFQEIPLPATARKLLKRHAVSLDTGGSGVQPRYGLRPRGELNKKACCGDHTDPFSNQQCCRDSYTAIERDTTRVGHATPRRPRRRPSVVVVSSDEDRPLQPRGLRTDTPLMREQIGAGRSADDLRTGPVCYVPMDRRVSIVRGRCTSCSGRPDKRSISDWTREVVREFVSGLYGAELANKLYHEEVDGRALLKMGEIGWKSIKLLPQVKVGPFLRLIEYLENL